MTIIIFGLMYYFQFRMFGFQYISWFSFFFILGVLSRKYESCIYNWGIRYGWFLIILHFLMSFWWRWKEPPSFMPETSSMAYNYVYRLVTAYFAIFGWFFFFAKFFNRRSFLSKLAYDTLGIYVIHLAIFKVIKQFVQSVYDNNDWLYVSMLWFVVFSSTLLINNLLKNYRITSFLLLGRKQYYENS